MNDEQETKQSKQSIAITFRNSVETTVFDDILAYQLGSGFIGVQTKEGRMYIYPSDLVSEVIYIQE